MSRKDVRAYRRKLKDKPPRLRNDAWSVHLARLLAPLTPDQEAAIRAAFDGKRRPTQEAAQLLKRQRGLCRQLPYEGWGHLVPSPANSALRLRQHLGHRAPGVDSDLRIPPRSLRRSRSQLTMGRTQAPRPDPSWTMMRPGGADPSSAPPLGLSIRNIPEDVG